MYQRTGSPRVRGSARIVRAASNQYWVEVDRVSTLVVANSTPVQIGILNAGLLSAYDQALKGVKLKRIVGRVHATSQTTPGAATDSTLTAGLVVVDSRTTAAQNDPLSGAQGAALPWVWRDWWFVPFTAAAPANQFVEESNRWCQVKRRKGNTIRTFRSNDEDLVLLFSSQAGANLNWSVRYAFRMLVQAP